MQTSRYIFMNVKVMGMMMMMMLMIRNGHALSVSIGL